MVQCATRWKRCANENNGWVCSSGQGDFAVSRSNAGESRGVYDATWKLWHCLPAEKLKDHRATQAHALEQSYRPTPDRVTPSRYSDDACCSSRSVFLGPPDKCLASSSALMLARCPGSWFQHTATATARAQIFSMYWGDPQSRIGVVQ